MEMNVEQFIPAPPQKVWDALNDVEVLKAAIPGCESLEVSGENQFKAKVTTKIGPVKAKFNFNVSLTDLQPPTSYTIKAEGQGGAAGFANGSADVALREQDDGTLLAYQARAQVGGKLAQMGSRLIDATAKKLADEFFNNFSQIVSSPGEPESVEAAPTTRQPLLPLWAWVMIAAIAVLLILRTLD